MEDVKFLFTDVPVVKVYLLLSSTVSEINDVLNQISQRDLGLADPKYPKYFLNISNRRYLSSVLESTDNIKLWTQAYVNDRTYFKHISQQLSYLIDENPEVFVLQITNNSYYEEIGAVKIADWLKLGYTDDYSDFPRDILSTYPENIHGRVNWIEQTMYADKVGSDLYPDSYVLTPEAIKRASIKLVKIYQFHFI